MKSPFVEFRAFSRGLLGPQAAMPSHVLVTRGAIKAGVLPSDAVLVRVIDGTTTPSDSLPARSPVAIGL